MIYTPAEKNILSLMKRTDFKNIGRDEIVSLTSKLGELRPDVAKEIIAQFPEYADMVKKAMLDYKEIISKIIDSDDASLNRYYDIADKELENAAMSREQFIEVAKRVLDDCGRLLENENLSAAEQAEILNHEVEILKLIDKKDSEIREHEKLIDEKANEKDSEKRRFGERLAQFAGIAVLMIAAAGLGALGGNTSIKLPGKKDSSEEIDQPEDTP